MGVEEPYASRGSFRVLRLSFGIQGEALNPNIS